MDAIMIFVGLCLIALAINNGLSELAEAIRHSVTVVHFKEPLRIASERRTNDPDA